MDLQNSNSHSDGFAQNERERRERAQKTFWRVVGTVYRRRRFIIGATACIAVLAIVISLLLPNWYRASTRLLMPEGGGVGGNLTAMLEEFAPAASVLLGGGGGGGDIDRYLTILSSRRIMDRVIEEFDLETVYETKDSQTPRLSAREALADNVDFVIDQEFGFLSVDVYDQDPQRAAAMANFFVEELNRVNANLMIQDAAHYRAFMEQNLRETEVALDSAHAALQRFQEAHGIIDLPVQTQAFLESIAQLRASVLQAEIQYEVLLQEYGPDNPQVRTAQSTAASVENKYQAALGGSEQLLPIPQGEVPERAREYAQLMQDVLIQTEILKLVRPLYEQARFDEQREKVAVQVLDPATPPEKKAKPVRSIIVILATLSGFLLAIIYVLAHDALRRHHRTLLARLQAAPDEDEPNAVLESSTHR